MRHTLPREVRRVPCSPQDVVIFVSTDGDDSRLEPAIVDEIAMRAGHPAGEIEIIRDAAGKPSVSLRGGTSDTWSVSFSYTAGCALAVVAQGLEVGVDIERLDTSIDWRTVAETFFVGETNARLRRMPPDAARLHFYKTWVRWEASLKLRGVGFREPLLSVDRACEGVTLVDLEIAPGYAAALAFGSPRSLGPR